MPPDNTLSNLIQALSEENYDETIAQYRSWFNIGSDHTHITVQIQVDHAIERLAWHHSLGGLIYPTAHLLIRFIGDIEADQKVSTYTPGLHMQFCTSALRRFFSNNLYLIMSWKMRGDLTSFLIDVNLIARWANLGYVEEEFIRYHILQSLTSQPIPYDHQADALIILFKLAGATFGAYTEPSVIDRCFELLKRHYGHNWVKTELLQVCVYLKW